jgi:hypothetical protein
LGARRCSALYAKQASRLISAMDKKLNAETGKKAIGELSDFGAS